MPPERKRISLGRTATRTGWSTAPRQRSTSCIARAGTIGAETHLPFGGWKETGNGHREAGHTALDTYTEWKAVYVDFSGRLQRAQIDNQPG